jgi:hypothetical protein
MKDLLLFLLLTAAYASVIYLDNHPIPFPDLTPYL